MKKTSRIISAVLALLMVASVLLTGCDQPGQTTTNNGGGGDNSGKSVLYVQNYNGGFGSKWIAEIEKRFEAAYANTSFEDGKMGVDVVIENVKDIGSTIQGGLDSQVNEVFVQESIYYTTWVTAGDMLDITDVVTSINTDGTKIEDMMSEEQKSFYNVDGSYYALPHHDLYTGIVYDIDLFVDKELYFAKNGAPSEDYASDKATEGGYSGTISYTGTGAKSAGPDGKHGTADDGLPATYEEFFILCEYMTTPTVGVTPFIWLGSHKEDYTNNLLGALATDYEGKEQASLFYSFNGTAKNLITVDSNGNITPRGDVEITEENGYEVFSSAGRYYALKFLEQLLTTGNGKYMHSICTGSAGIAQTHNEYIQSSYKGQPIAFMAEGNWWENESDDIFGEMAAYYGDEYSRTSRNFGYLPFPKATNDKIGEDVTYYSYQSATAFIKSSIKEEKIELAKTFLKFMYTLESMNEFTSYVGTRVSLNYEIDADVYNSLSTFSKQLCDITSDHVATAMSNSYIYNIYNKQFMLQTTFLPSSGQAAIKKLREGTSAADYFNEIISTKFTEEAWARYLK